MSLTVNKGGREVVRLYLVEDVGRMVLEEEEAKLLENPDSAIF